MIDMAVVFRDLPRDGRALMSSCYRLRPHSLHPLHIVCTCMCCSLTSCSTPAVLHSPPLIIRRLVPLMLLSPALSCPPPRKILLLLQEPIQPLPRWAGDAQQVCIPRRLRSNVCGTDAHHSSLRPLAAHHLAQTQPCGQTLMASFSHGLLGGALGPAGDVTTFHSLSERAHTCTCTDDKPKCLRPALPHPLVLHCNLYCNYVHARMLLPSLVVDGGAACLALGHHHPLHRHACHPTATPTLLFATRAASPACGSVRPGTHTHTHTHVCMHPALPPLFASCSSFQTLSCPSSVLLLAS